MSNEKQAEGVLLKGAERRTAQRSSTRGKVKLRPENPWASAITADLVDTSAGGFRACHHCPTLTTGQTVWFEWESAEGRAIVVWNRMLGANVESGFAFLQE
jgi:hypothetical protein